MDWKWFIEQSEHHKKEDQSVRISVDVKNGFSKNVLLKDFLPLISEYQRLADACNEHGYDVGEKLRQAINGALSRIRETVFVSTLGKKLSSIYPDVYIRIEWHEGNEYFVGFYGFEGDEREATVFIDSLQEELDKDGNFYLFPFVHTVEQKKKYYPNYVGKTGFDVLGI